MVSCVLIANRGEIACRIVRSVRMLGLRSVTVFTEVDAKAPHRFLADDARSLGDDPMAYLDMRAIIDAAQKSGADAIHPGYGFLSQNPDFAQACLDADLVWIGPSPDVIRVLGDKRSSRQAAERSGVPVIPGAEECNTPEEAEVLAQRIGFPLLLKAAGGGGGKGMRQVDGLADIREAFVSAEREARNAFGDGRLLLEKFIRPARHIEVQILGDAIRSVAVGVRECSLQRRYQKVLEESPPPLLAHSILKRIAGDAERLMTAAGYSSAGTVEFLVDADGHHYFLEVNTRIQVEHPVTELVTGVDIVAEQIRIACGGSVHDAPEPRGHAIELRLNAEDPACNYLPCTGEVRMLRWPQVPGVRIDAGITEGSLIGSHYDPMIAKIIAWGSTRSEALQRLRQALQELVLLGVGTNQGMLLDLIEEPWVQRGETFTHTLETWSWIPPEMPEIYKTLHGSQSPSHRQGHKTHADHIVGAVRELPSKTTSVVGAVREPPFKISSPRGIWVSDRGRVYLLPSEDDTSSRQIHRKHGVIAPMTGKVVAIHVQVGDVVIEGQVVAILEAMKMEYRLTAPHQGTVSKIACIVGTLVDLGQAILMVDP